MAPGTPDRKAELARERLIEAAGEVLASGSYASMPLRAVASRAGATTGAIQHHFGDKRGLLLAVMRQHGLRIVERLQRLDTGTLPPPEVRIKKILLEFLPLDRERRHEAIVADVFENLAIHDPVMADAFRQQYSLLAELITDQLPHASATHAEHLLAFTGGLRTDLLLDRMDTGRAIASLESFIELIVPSGSV